jgi:hypothetical protein
MQFLFVPMEAWPPLAWLALCRPGDCRIYVAHGNRVETRPDWFAEAVWDGRFETGGFDRTDLVFGTGGRIRKEGVVFVSSATTVERLHSLATDDGMWISNSLPCLLAAADASVDPDYPRYFQDFETIIRGIKDYRRAIATSAGSVKLTYYDDLIWRDDRLSEIPKARPSRDFGTFVLYRDFLESSLCRIAENMRSDLRACPCEMLSTISSGYDSPTVAAVARRAGLRQTLSFSSARDGRPDSGAEIARHLGLEPLVVESSSWRGEPYAEVPFIASDAKGEDVYFHGAADLLQGRVLLTGYSGSRVWDKGDKMMEHFQRSDQSGLSLCEFRLWAGFVHCPVTYLGGAETRKLRAISNSSEMRPWDLPGAYSRPICRRILEEAGVPRSLFGMEKKAASVLLFDRNSFLSPASLADYRCWLEQNCRRFMTGRRGLPGATRRALSALKAGTRSAIRGIQSLAGAAHAVVPLDLFGRVGSSGRLTVYANHEPLFDHVFPWALETAKRRYAGADAFCAEPWRHSKIHAEQLAKIVAQ